MTDPMQRTQAAPCFPETIPDCTCPFEHWHLGPTNICLDVHFEEDGSAHFLLDAGDWDHEHVAHGLQTMAQAREAAFKWADKLIAAPAAPSIIDGPDGPEFAALVEQARPR